MIFEDFHIHTTFSDGKNTPNEVVLSAIEKGISRLGFSDHSYTYFDESYCMKKEKYADYINEINYLKEKYSDKIKIYCGIEQDYYSDVGTSDFDYSIGSVHYIKTDDIYIPVDESPEILLNAVEKYFNGDIFALIDCYFNNVSDVLNKTNADIIGHFDLITKFNENNALFDMCRDKYLDIAKRAVDRLIPYGKPFEINTGAVSRGYRSSPYPSYEIIEYIIEKNGKLILSSDSHSSENIIFEFEKYFKSFSKSIVNFHF